MNHFQSIICLSHNLKYFIEECIYSKLIDRIPTRMSVHYSEEAARKYFKTNWITNLLSEAGRKIMKEKFLRTTQKHKVQFFQVKCKRETLLQHSKIIISRIRNFRNRGEEENKNVCFTRNLKK